mmetsp:Transcript_31208/g.61098  ORF Transcript_31208/g.61098 Transcript_31208/m.61098 type:complete len:255 (+) Transcript_31208:66-830(+)
MDSPAFQVLVREQYNCSDVHQPFPFPRLHETEGSRDVDVGELFYQDKPVTVLELTEGGDLDGSPSDDDNLDTSKILLILEQVALAAAQLHNNLRGDNMEQRIPITESKHDPRENTRDQDDISVLMDSEMEQSDEPSSSSSPSSTPRSTSDACVRPPLHSEMETPDVESSSLPRGTSGDPCGRMDDEAVKKCQKQGLRPEIEALLPKIVWDAEADRRRKRASTSSNEEPVSITGGGKRKKTSSAGFGTPAKRQIK